MSKSAENSVFSPGVFSAIAYGWQRSKACAAVFLLAQAILAVLDVDFLEEVTGLHDHPSVLVNFTFGAYMVFFVSVISFGRDWIFLRGIRGDDISIKQILDGFNNYASIVLVSLLAIGLVGISLVFLVIPGIYVACRLSFISFLIMDEGLGPIEAVKASWRTTSGHVWKILGLALIAIAVGVPIIALVAALADDHSFLYHARILFTIPVVVVLRAAFAALYFSVTQQSSNTLEDRG